MCIMLLAVDLVQKFTKYLELFKLFDNFDFFR